MLAVYLAAALFAAACASAGPVEAPVVRQLAQFDEPGAAIEVIQVRNGLAFQLSPWRDITELTRLAAEGKLDIAPVVVAKGRFGSARPGPAFSWTLEPDGAVRSEVAVGDAELHMFLVEFVPSSTIVGQVEQSIQVAIPMRPGITERVVEGDFSGLGEVLVVLGKTPVTDWDESLWSVLGNETYLATIDPSTGALSFPMARDHRTAFISNSEGLTLEQVVAASRSDEG